jgi:maleate cis-trans isomerase
MGGGITMFGWRRRIGYITPTVMEVAAYDFYRFAPDGVGLVAVTCGIDDWRPEEFEKGLAQVNHFAAYLGSRGVDFVIHGGGPLVVARGGNYEAEIVNGIEAASGVRATTGVRAAQEALHAIGARRVAIASPYPPAHNEAMAAYLRSKGFDIVHAEGCNIGFKDLQNVPPIEIYRFIRDVAARAGDCDAIYLPCPQWQTAALVPTLECDTGKPVIAYTHANFFVAFRALGLRDAIRGHGRLLASLADGKG